MSDEAQPPQEPPRTYGVPACVPARSLVLAQVADRVVYLWHGNELGELTSGEMCQILFALGVAAQLQHEVELDEKKRREG